MATGPALFEPKNIGIVPSKGVFAGSTPPYQNLPPRPWPIKWALIVPNDFRYTVVNNSIVDWTTLGNELLRRVERAVRQWIEIQTGKTFVSEFFVVQSSMSSAKIVSRANDASYPTNWRDASLGGCSTYRITDGPNNSSTTKPGPGYLDGASLWLNGWPLVLGQDDEVNNAGGFSYIFDPQTGFEAYKWVVLVVNARGWAYGGTWDSYKRGVCGVGDIWFYRELFGHPNSCCISAYDDDDEYICFLPTEMLVGHELAHMLMGDPEYGQVTRNDPTWWLAHNPYLYYSDTMTTEQKNAIIANSANFLKEINVADRPASQAVAAFFPAQFFELRPGSRINLLPHLITDQGLRVPSLDEVEVSVADPTIARYSQGFLEAIRPGSTVLSVRLKSSIGGQHVTVLVV